MARMSAIGEFAQKRRFCDLKMSRYGPNFEQVWRDNPTPPVGDRSFSGSPEGRALQPPTNLATAQNFGQHGQYAFSDQKRVF
jgi:hypothetical protein